MFNRHDTHRILSKIPFFSDQEKTDSNVRHRVPQRCVRHSTTLGVNFLNEKFSLIDELRTTAYGSAVQSAVQLAWTLSQNLVLGLTISLVFYLEHYPLLNSPLFPTQPLGYLV